MGSSSKVTATEINRALRNAEIVTTHVHHVVDEEHSDGAVSTVCNYHLNAEQYEQRREFHDTYVSVTHLCHHCTAAMRDRLEIGEEVVTDV